MIHVLDASSVLSVILKEHGAQRVIEAMSGDAVLSAVNLCEVVARLAAKGFDAAETHRVRQSLQNALRILPVDEQVAYDAGRAILHTKKMSISLADRICLMQARYLDAIALTGDRKWLEVADVLGVRVELIR